MDFSVPILCWEKSMESWMLLLRFVPFATLNISIFPLHCLCLSSLTSVLLWGRSDISGEEKRQWERFLDWNRLQKIVATPRRNCSRLGKRSVTILGPRIREKNMTAQNGSHRPIFIFWSFIFFLASLLFCHLFSSSLRERKYKIKVETKKKWQSSQSQRDLFFVTILLTDSSAARILGYKMLKKTRSAITRFLPFPAPAVFGFWICCLWPGLGKGGTESWVARRFVYRPEGV